MAWAAQGRGLWRQCATSPSISPSPSPSSASASACAREHGMQGITHIVCGLACAVCAVCACYTAAAGAAKRAPRARATHAWRGDVRARTCPIESRLRLPLDRSRSCGHSGSSRLRAARARPAGSSPEAAAGAPSAGVGCSAESGGAAAEPASCVAGVAAADAVGARSPGQSSQPGPQGRMFLRHASHFAPLFGGRPLFLGAGVGWGSSAAAPGGRARSGDVGRHQRDAAHACADFCGLSMGSWSGWPAASLSSCVCAASAGAPLISRARKNPGSVAEDSTGGAGDAEPLRAALHRLRGTHDCDQLRSTHTR